MAYLLMTAGIMALGLFLASRLANACGFLVKGRALALAGFLACGIAVVLPILAPFLTRDYYWKLGLLVLIAALLVTAYNARLVKKDLAAAEQAAAETPASAAPPEQAPEQMPEAARQAEEQAGEARPDIPTSPVQPAAAAADKKSDSAAPAPDAPAPPQEEAPPAADAAAQPPQETAPPAADAAAQPPQETALPAADAAAQPPQEEALPAADAAAQPPQEEAASTADTARQAPQTEAPAVPIAPAAFTKEDSRPPRDAAPPPPPVTEEHASARHTPAAQMPEGHTPEKRPSEAAAQTSEKHAPEAPWAKDLAALTTLDAFLDYAYAAQQRGDIPRALAAYREALKRYSGDPYVPYLFIDLGNLCKQQARYADCIEVYRRGLRLPIIAENEAMAEEFRKNIRYLRIVYHILEKHQALATPFGSIPQTYRAEIETAYQAAQAQHHGS